MPGTARTPKKDKKGNPQSQDGSATSSEPTNPGQGPTPSGGTQIPGSPNYTPYNVVAGGGTAATPTQGAAGGAAATPAQTASSPPPTPDPSGAKAKVTFDDGKTASRAGTPTSPNETFHYTDMEYGKEVKKATPCHVPDQRLWAKDKADKRTALRQCNKLHNEFDRAFRADLSPNDVDILEHKLQQFDRWRIVAIEACMSRIRNVNTALVVEILDKTIDHIELIHAQASHQYKRARARIEREKAVDQARFSIGSSLGRGQAIPAPAPVPVPTPQQLPKYQVKLPEISLSKWSGKDPNDIVKYPDWKRSFEDTFGKHAQLSDDDKFRALLTVTEPPARDMIKALTGDNRYDDSWRILDNAYGSPDKITMSYHRQLLNLPILSPNPSAAELRARRQFLDQSFRALSLRDSGLPPAQMLLAGVDKLSASLYEKWEEYKIGKIPEPDTFLAFMDTRITLLENLETRARLLDRTAPLGKQSKSPPTGATALTVQKSPQPSPEEAATAKVVNAIMAQLAKGAISKDHIADAVSKAMKKKGPSKQSSPRKFDPSKYPQPEKCPACSKAYHLISSCDAFRKMDVMERWNIVAEQHVCFCCLKYGHGSDTCPSRSQCGTDGCKGAHNPLLHKTREQRMAEKQAKQKQ